MKIHNAAQGTAEWLNARMGKITGTDVDPFCLDPRPVTLTIPQIQKELDRLAIEYKKSGSRAELIARLPNGGLDYVELSKAARNLLITKIVDSKPQDQWQLAQRLKEERQFSYLIPIDRGNKLEPAARNYYERKTGLTVTQVGFCSDDEETLGGMSPDGLIFSHLVTPFIEGFTSKGDILKGVEIKCPMPETHLRWLDEHYGKGTVPNDHFYQCQMGMVICECDEWDFLSFCPGYAPLLVTLKRSEITDQLAEGLRVLREEREILEEGYASMWDLEYGTPEGQTLLCYPNGAPMFTADGMMLDENGNRSIFDDVDAGGES